MNLFEELDTLEPSGKPTPPRIENPTPHKIAVLILLKQYIADKKSSLDSGVIMNPQRRRMFCMLMFKIVQEADMSYYKFHNLLTSHRYKLDTLLLEAFEKAMSEFCANGIEALFDFSESQNIDNLLNESWGVSQFSMMGVYVRRVGVVLERFSFSEMVGMYKNFCTYYETGVRALAVGPNKQIAGGILHRAETPPATTEEKTDDKNEVALRINKPESANAAPSCSDAVVTEPTGSSSMGKWAPKQAKVFINKQSELLEHSERNALPPIELHRKVQEIINDIPLATTPYFLGYMNQLRVRDYKNALAALHRALDRSPVRMMSQEKGYQYFCVNLAVLHATFGHRDEALAALREGIMLAQEHGDKRSLNLANTWYCLLRDELPLSSVQRSVAEAADTDGSLLQNHTLALHFAVKLGTVAGYQPLRLFDLLQRSDNLTNRNNFADHASEALALRSAVWCAYGRHELSALYAQLLLVERDRFCRGSASVGSALASYALWLQLQGEMQLSHVLLYRAREHLPRMPSAECWMISQCHVIIQSGIYRCRWHDAMKACDQLHLLDPADAMLQRATIYVAKREFFNARRLLDKLVSQTQMPFLIRIRVQLLLGYCSLADGRFSSETVTLLLGVAEEMTESQMDYELALVDMVLAQLLLLLGMPQKAYQAIKHCMEDVHINGGLYERAKTDFVFVRCLLAIAGTDADLRKAQLLKSVDVLQRAAQAFKKLEAHAKVLDVYVFLAQRFNEIGERQLRNKYAGEFRRYYTEHPIPREYLGMVY
ncbi:anaphase-promoting complex subunit 5 [Scaptodrosophila lebanonensis]|uniref:Anaphase-promoting complex subunit 5 n=1 Tax=Drosophila lebanonensis TaxID=7225 RepID=A0A6J2TVT7_DROLE|nr:anaphase-promoting complex subunit 5 [Scaptodrosophila lebanonensis]